MHRHVIVIEDIVDTGHTMLSLTRQLRAYQAVSVKVIALLNKPMKREVEFEPDYTGFSIENKFVVGYGMDLDEQFRGLKEIYYVEGDENVRNTNDSTQTTASYNVPPRQTTAT